MRTVDEGNAGRVERELCWGRLEGGAVEPDTAREVWGRAGGVAPGVLAGQMEGRESFPAADSYPKLRKPLGKLSHHLSRLLQLKENKKIRVLTRLKICIYRTTLCLKDIGLVLKAAVPDF